MRTDHLADYTFRCFFVLVFHGFRHVAPVGCDFTRPFWSSIIALGHGTSIDAHNTEFGSQSIKRSSE